MNMIEVQNSPLMVYHSTQNNHIQHRIRICGKDVKFPVCYVGQYKLTSGDPYILFSPNLGLIILRIYVSTIYQTYKY